MVFQTAHGPEESGVDNFASPAAKRPLLKALIWLVLLALLAAVIFGIVYGGIKNSGPTSPGIQGGMLGAAGLLTEHAAVMRQHGQRMIETGTDTGRRQWTDQGSDLLKSARSMESLGDQLRRIDFDLSLFPPSGSLDLYRLRADGEGIVAAGRGLVEHGEKMAATAEAMAAEADTAELQEDARLLKGSAETMVQDGRAVIPSGQRLLDQADQMERSLGH